ncbi:ribonuclease H-like domain-containing protein [Kalaharituber pfeilii]|nr:ribonuclease H-like domain-containing protein [Kalaharituber pfeilii]
MSSSPTLVANTSIVSSAKSQLTPNEKNTKPSLVRLPRMPPDKELTSISKHYWGLIEDSIQRIRAVQEIPEEILSILSLHVTLGYNETLNSEILAVVKEWARSFAHPIHPSDLGREEWERLIAKEEDEGWTSIYTDGSRMEDKTGTGVHQTGEDTSIYLGERCTVNDAELIAVGEAMRREGELLIITDSRTTVTRMKGIARGDLTPEGAAELVRRRWEERTSRGDRDLALLWVKAHEGIVGNTEADRAAKVATALQYQDETVTEAGIRQEAKSRRGEERKRLQLTYRPLEYLGTRRRVSTFAGIMGDKGLRQWRYQIGKEESPECRWCGKALENYRHITKDCEAWKKRLPGGEAGMKMPKGGEKGKKKEGEKEGMKLVEVLDWAAS